MFRKSFANVSDTERYVAGLLGAVFLAVSLRSWRPLSLYCAACLFYRAIRGHCPTYEMLGLKSRSPEHTP